MATITSDTYLDGGTARTAGESWTCNGGRLTVRTDSRWHANSPASMTGSIGSVNISSTLGGGYTITGESVRWMAFDAGGGTVPAIGTTVTGGTSGASGYLLGVWASITSAPTAVGAAMPSTGYIKFREVTGAFVDNDALSGITATSDGVDVVGWIEVVHDQSATITVPRLGDSTIRGEWFSLGTTTGMANQVVQLPTNGSATTYAQGLWIETSPGSGTYEFYPSIATSLMTTTNLGTDVRSKFVGMNTTGGAIIGGNGVDTVGYLPATGCAIRVPNIFVRQCTTAARATNAIPHATVATRPEFLTTSAGVIDHELVNTDWYYNLSQPSQVRLNYVSNFDTALVSECAGPLDINEFHNNISASLDVNSLALTSNFAGGTVSNCKQHRYQAGTSDHSVYVQYCKDQTLSNVEAGIIQYARSSGRFQLSYCTNVTLNDCRAINGNLTLATCNACTVNDYDCVDRFVGTTNSTTAQYALAINSSCSNIVVDGLTFGHNGTVSDVHPYTGVVYIQSSSNIKVRNFGTIASPLNGGSVNAVGYIFGDGGNNDTVKLQRLYVQPTRTGAISTFNSSNNMVIEHVYGDYADTMAVASLNTEVKNCAGTNTTTGQSSVYGTHFWDAFTSNTAGRVVLSLNEPTTTTDPYVTIVAGTPRFTSAGNLSMPTLADEIVIEQSYYVKGCTGLPSTDPVITGTNVTYSSGARWGNHDIYFQIDTGSGWNGSWLDFTGTNLNTFTASIDPSTGFKLKYRIVTATAATTNLITYIRISTDSTLVAQTDNLYPLDTYTLTITGLETGSRVAFVGTGTEALKQNVTAESGGSVSYTYSSDDVGDAIDIAFMAPGFKYSTISGYTLTAADASIPVTQVVDNVYAAASTSKFEIDGDGTAYGTAHRIYGKASEVSAGVFSFTQEELYNEWVAWALTGNNLRYFPAFRNTGGDDIGGGSYVGNYVFLMNDVWKGVPPNVSPVVVNITGSFYGDNPSATIIDMIPGNTTTLLIRNSALALGIETGSGGGGDAKEDIYTYFTTSSRQDAFKADVSSLPTLSEIEASTVLAKEATITAIKAKTDNLPSDPASETSVATRLASASYTAPDNAGIASIESTVAGLALETTAQSALSAARLAAALSA